MLDKIKSSVVDFVSKVKKKKKTLFLIGAIGILIVIGLLLFLWLRRPKPSSPLVEPNKSRVSPFLSPSEKPDNMDAFDKLIPCPQNLLSTDEEILALSEDWWEKLDEPHQCDSFPEQTVCGHTRYVYDNGQEQVQTEERRNPCEYCSFFNKDGVRGLRGTKMYTLGYKDGSCK